jgi:hypothetical protein
MQGGHREDLPPAVDAILEDVAPGVLQIPFQLSRTVAEVPKGSRRFRRWAAIEARLIQ